MRHVFSSFAFGLITDAKQRQRIVRYKPLALSAKYERGMHQTYKCHRVTDGYVELNGITILHINVINQ